MNLDYQNELRTWLSNHYICTCDELVDLLSKSTLPIEYTEVAEELIEQINPIDYEATIENSEFDIKEKGGVYYYYEVGDFTSIREALTYQSYNSYEECAESCIYNHSLDEEYLEFYEHYVIDSSLAYWMEKAGAHIIDLFEFKVWCRPCTGQWIGLDCVVQKAHKLATEE